MYLTAKMIKSNNFNAHKFNRRNLKCNPPIAEQANLPITEQTNLPIAEQANLPIAEQTNLPIAEQANLPITEQTNQKKTCIVIMSDISGSMFGTFDKMKQAMSIGHDAIKDLANYCGFGVFGNGFKIYGGIRRASHINKMFDNLLKKEYFQEYKISKYSFSTELFNTIRSVAIESDIVTQIRGGGKKQIAETHLIFITDAFDNASNINFEGINKFLASDKDGRLQNTHIHILVCSQMNMVSSGHIHVYKINNPNQSSLNDVVVWDFIKQKINDIIREIHK